MIYMEQRHLDMVLDILSQSPVPFYAFGSRVTGTHRILSDLDLCYKADIPRNILNKITADFEESDLPFKVDIVNYQQCSNGFKKVIDKDLTPIG